MRPYIDFWDSLDDLLMTMFRDTEAYVYGPEKIGRWCCNTCTAAELSLMADADNISDPVFFYYHDQNRDTDSDECYLGWSGGQRALDLIKQYCDYYGLVVELPENEDKKILVKDN